jgi:gamma-glutamylcyclotransferase (GGCT)/AIG2-like uncharacterized protein YtfP
MILAVYGNFREGEPLSHYLHELKKDAEIQTVTLPGVKLFVMGQAPGAMITEEEEDKAVVELIKNDTLTPRMENRWLLLLDKVEGVGAGLYDRSTIMTPLGMAYIYTCNLSPKGFPVIQDWLEWNRRSRKEKMRALKGLNAESVFVTLQ